MAVSYGFMGVVPWGAGGRLLCMPRRKTKSKLASSAFPTDLA